MGEELNWNEKRASERESSRETRQKCVDRNEQRRFRCMITNCIPGRLFCFLMVIFQNWAHESNANVRKKCKLLSRMISRRQRWQMAKIRSHNDELNKLEAVADCCWMREKETQIQTESNVINFCWSYARATNKSQRFFFFRFPSNHWLHWLALNVLRLLLVLLESTKTLTDKYHAYADWKSRVNKAFAVAFFVAKFLIRSKASHTTTCATTY